MTSGTKSVSKQLIPQIGTSTSSTSFSVHHGLYIIIMYTILVIIMTHLFFISVLKTPQARVVRARACVRACVLYACIGVRACVCVRAYACVNARQRACVRSLSLAWVPTRCFN